MSNPVTNIKNTINLPSKEEREKGVDYQQEEQSSCPLTQIEYGIHHLYLRKKKTKENQIPSNS